MDDLDNLVSLKHNKSHQVIFFAGVLSADTYARENKDWRRKY